MSYLGLFFIKSEQCIVYIQISPYYSYKIYFIVLICNQLSYGIIFQHTTLHGGFFSCIHLSSRYVFQSKNYFFSAICYR
ncbi:protein of unknown function [Cardinium endosymbiont cEper1 of Encarsia pergandiella]|nr:protein of unknown function [Cardinium endosymbiont cEper1 of Encarsia pergandiella]